MTADAPQPLPQSSLAPLRELPNWLCLCILAVLTLATFGDVLFLTPHEVLSDGTWDLNRFFLHWRFFGFTELKAGHLPLWNPHYDAGAPFFGNFQSALLYPLNFLFLFLHLDRAINWTIALHIFLGGAFTFYWVRNRGLHSLACLLAAIMFMFCGTHFLQIHVGHLPNLCTLIWAPLLFLAIDKAVDRPSLDPCLLGMFAFAMSILAGHVQYVFFMGIGAGIYSILNLIRSRNRARLTLCLALIVFGGIALSAIQLFTGLQETRESIRSLGMSYDFVSTYSFPPENFLTLFAPWFFGDMKNSYYWGRWFLTEVSFFVSIIGLVLAICGALCGRPETRRFALVMIAVTVVLAMGCYTPFLHLLYNYVPGFDKFRGFDKFLWLASLFLSLLAAIGLDRIIKNGNLPTWTVPVVATAGIGFWLLALLPQDAAFWTGVLKLIPPTGSTLLPSNAYTNPGFIQSTGARASASLLKAGLTLFAVAALIDLIRSRRRLACVGMVTLAVIELSTFARTSLMTFHILPPYPPSMVQLLAEHPGDYRIRYRNPNAALSMGTFDLAGDDPAGLLRYIRFLDFTEGIDFDREPYGTSARQYDTNAWRMVRYRYFFGDDAIHFAEAPDFLPHLLLVNRYRVMTDFHQIFTTITNSSFDMNHEVILENQPDPAPQTASQPGSVTLENSTSDTLTIAADVRSASLLFVTDAYSSNWRILPLLDDTQARYTIMPANYCLRAVPLSPGHHHFIMEYSPSGFRAGRIVSLIALPIFLALCGIVLFGRARKGDWP